MIKNNEHKSPENDDIRYVPVDEDGYPLDEDEDVVPLDDHTNFFYTFDLGLSAALVCVGFSLVSLDRRNLRKVQFVFRRGDGMDEVVDAYWDNNLEVKARAYFDALKMLKNRLYSSE